MTTLLPPLSPRQASEQQQQRSHTNNRDNQEIDDDPDNRHHPAAPVMNCERLGLALTTTTSPSSVLPRSSVTSSARVATIATLRASSASGSLRRCSATVSTPWRPLEAPGRVYQA